MELFVTGANAAEPRHIINRNEISTMISNAVSSATAMRLLTILLLIILL